MDGPKKSVEQAKNAPSTSAENAPAKVFQPKALKEAVEIINLMGNISTRASEDRSGDMGGGGGGAVTAGGQASGGKSARDIAIEHAPPVPVMQKKLVSHLEREMRNVQKQIRKLSASNQRGAAHSLNDLYKKLRRMSTIISEILRASGEVIKRFYVAVFIDKQPLVITGGKVVDED